MAQSPAEQASISVGVTAPFQTGNTAGFHQLTSELVEAVKPAFVSVAFISRLTDVANGQLLDEMFTYCREVPVVPHLDWWWRTSDSMAKILATCSNTPGIDRILISPPNAALKATEQRSARGRDQPNASSLISLAREAGDFTIGVCVDPYRRNRGDLNTIARELAAADFAVAGPTYSAPVHAQLLQSLSRRGLNKPVVPSLEVKTSGPSLHPASRVRLGRLLLRREAGLHIYTHGNIAPTVDLIESILK